VLQCGMTACIQDDDGLVRVRPVNHLEVLVAGDDALGIDLVSLLVLAKHLGDHVRRLDSCVDARGVHVGEGVQLHRSSTFSPRYPKPCATVPMATRPNSIAIPIQNGRVTSHQDQAATGAMPSTFSNTNATPKIPSTGKVTL